MFSLTCPGTHDTHQQREQVKEKAAFDINTVQKLSYPEKTLCPAFIIYSKLLVK